MSISEFAQSNIGVLVLGALASLLAQAILALARAALRRLPVASKRLTNLVLRHPLRSILRLSVLAVVVLEDKRPFGSGIFFAYHLAKVQVFSVLSSVFALVLYLELRAPREEVPWWIMILLAAGSLFSAWQALYAFCRMLAVYLGYWFERGLHNRRLAEVLGDLKSFDLEQGLKAAGATATPGDETEEDPPEGWTQ